MPHVATTAFLVGFLRRDYGAVFLMDAARDGSRSVGETVEAMETINAAMESTSARIEELSESGKEIGNITQTISDIAEAVHLLFLFHA